MKQERIKTFVKWRKDNKISQRYMALLSGVSYHTILRIEQGYSLGSDVTWEKLNNVIIKLEKE